MNTEQYEEKHTFSEHITVQICHLRLQSKHSTLCAMLDNWVASCGGFLVWLLRQIILKIFMHKLPAHKGPPLIPEDILNTTAVTQNCEHCSRYVTNAAIFADENSLTLVSMLSATLTAQRANTLKQNWQLHCKSKKPQCFLTQRRRKICITKPLQYSKATGWATGKHLAWSKYRHPKIHVLGQSLNRSNTRTTGQLRKNHKTCSTIVVAAATLYHKDERCTICSTKVHKAHINSLHRYHRHATLHCLRYFSVVSAITNGILL